jgi:replicative DNA helicase
MQKFDSNTGQLVVDHYLPHNFLAEKIILSSLLISSESIEICLRSLTMETFYFRNHQEIYKAILVMYRKKIPIDIVTLSTFLQENGLLTKVGGIKVLIELINQVPNLIYLEEYICLIQEKYIRRSLIKFGYQAINSGYITNFSLERILTELETQMFNLTNKSKNQTIPSSVDIFSKILLELKQKSLKPQLPGLSSGFYDLDSLTQGFQKSDLIIIASRPSMGKTALSLNIAVNIVKSTKLPVLFFSLEMSKEQLAYRLLAIEANLNPMRLRSGNLDKKDWLKLNAIIKDLSNLTFFIDDTPNLSIQDVRSKIKKIIFEHNAIGLIVIDYLQLMQNLKLKPDNRVQELSQITRSLKTIAREFKVPLIALSQLSRNVENRITKRPILSDLRESGSIEQDADIVLMLYRENYYNLSKQTEDLRDIIDLTELILAKHRNGPLGTIRLRFDANHTKFLNYLSE